MKETTRTDLTRLEQICCQVRRALLKVQSEYRPWSNDLGGACAIASTVLADALREEGFDASVTCAQNHASGHCWVTLQVDGEDYALDVTATQFYGPEIVVMPLSEYLVEDFTTVFRPIHDLHEAGDAMNEVEGWPTWQRPSKWSSIVMDEYREIVDWDVKLGSNVVYFGHVVTF